MLSIIASGALMLLEKELVKHAPEIQKAIVGELGKVVDVMLQYLEAKVESKAQSLEHQDGDIDSKSA